MFMSVLDPDLHRGVKFVLSICFETDLVVSVLSVLPIRIRNTETDRKIYFLVSRNKPKFNRNRFSFGLFRFDPNFISVCFENTLFDSVTKSGVHCVRESQVYRIVSNENLAI
jgi:hypothetical protein